MSTRDHSSSGALGSSEVSILASATFFERFLVTLGVVLLSRVAVGRNRAAVPAMTTAAVNTMKRFRDRLDRLIVGRLCRACVVDGCCVNGEYTNRCP